MKTLRLFLILLIVTISLSAQKKGTPERFSISGTVTGFADSTILYLSDLATRQYVDVDSTIILNGKFSFSGILKQRIEKFAIHTKHFKDRVAFWIDTSPTTIIAAKGLFREAIITGAKAQAEAHLLNSIINTSKDTKADYIKFIQEHPSSIVSAETLTFFCPLWNKDTVSILYKQLSPAIKRSQFGKEIFDFITFSKNPKIGDKYVDFSQKNINDQIIRLSDFKGKIVLLEFWGSWCTPCRKAHPELIKTYNAFRESGFEILGIAADTNKKDLTTAIQEDGLPWQNVSDFKGDKNKAAIIYSVSKYPTNFLIDRNGIIIAKDIHGDKLREKLKELLQ